MKKLDDEDCVIWVVIPAYNEQLTIGSVIEDLKNEFTHIVVVDDCSADDTQQTAIQSGAYVCRHIVNLGQGAALQTGVDFSVAKGASHIVTFDADGQHNVEDAVAMCRLLLGNDNIDVVLASRFLGSTEGMSVIKHAVLRLAILYTRMSTGLTVTDTHNGLKAFTRHAAKTIKLQQNRMAHASEFLNQVAGEGLKYQEFGARVRYTEYSKSKGQSVLGAFSVLLDLIVRRLYR